MFALTEKQTKAVDAWYATLPKEYTGAIGGRLTYQFTPTGIGTIVTVHDQVSDQTIDVTDYDEW